MAGPDGEIPADTPSEGRRESPNGPRLALGHREAKRSNTDGLWPVVGGLALDLKSPLLLLGCRLRRFSRDAERLSADGLWPVAWGADAGLKESMTLAELPPRLLLSCRRATRVVELLAGNFSCDGSGGLAMPGDLANYEKIRWLLE